MFIKEVSSGNSPLFFLWTLSHGISNALPPTHCCMKWMSSWRLLTIWSQATCPKVEWSSYTAWFNETGTITLDDKDLSRTEQFKHLPSMLSTNGEVPFEIANVYLWSTHLRRYKIQNLRQCSSSVHPLWFWVLIHYQRQWTALRGNRGKDVALKKNGERSVLDTS